MRSEPERSAPFEFARKKYPECNYGQLTVRRIQDWKASLRSAVPRWFEQATFKSKQEMIDRAGSIDAVATSAIEALTEIDDVHAAWLVDISAPFHNSLVIEHNSWMSSVSLGGAPKGILA